jgi:glutamyl-tRNA reductase
MQIVAAGLSHKNAELALREKFAVLPHSEIYRRLKESDIADAIVLSTCNRFEIYACGFSRGADGPAVVLHFLEDLIGEGSLKDDLYLYSGYAAVEHLFNVASGLDSLVVGETEILGQVKESYERAKESGLTGKTGNVLFQRALYVGKKVRNETGIAVGQTSVASVAVELAQSIFGNLSKSEVLILGAGQMAELMARHLLTKKVARLSISNRTQERAKTLAQSLGAQVVPWENRHEALASADIVLASTGAPEAVITKAMLSGALKDRAGRSLFIVDIAMPRDVEEGVHLLEHVYVYRLEDLERVVAKNLKNRSGEIGRAKSLVDQKAEEFRLWLDSVQSGQELSLKHSALPKASRV